MFDLFCTHDIYHDIWERDPSSVAPPEVSSIFSPLKRFFGGIFFPYSSRGSKDKRVSYAVQIAKPLEANCAL